MSEPVYGETVWVDMPGYRYKDVFLCRIPGSETAVMYGAGGVYTVPMEQVLLDPCTPSSAETLEALADYAKEWRAGGLYCQGCGYWSTGCLEDYGVICPALLVAFLDAR